MPAAADPPTDDSPAAAVACPSKCFDVVERRLGAIEDDLAELKARPKPTDLGTIPADLAVLTAQGVATNTALGKMTEALLGNGKPGLVTRMDRVERSQGWIARVFWIVFSGSLLTTVGFGVKYLLTGSGG